MILPQAMSTRHPLDAYERETSSQLLVAIFKAVPQEAEMVDFSQGVFEAWKPGLAGKDNGAILFVFAADRKLRIHTGNGLEGALPDARCKQIIEEVITPLLREGRREDAIRAAEAQTSGEIRVVVTTRRALFPEHHARRLFAKLGMNRTRHRNGALIVLFARRRRFVVLGVSGFDPIIGPDYWQGFAAEMGAPLHDGRKAEALSSAIRTIGGTMAAHWPPDASNPDELPNAIHRE